ncbi:MAG: lamin tail domain-containing protein [Chitinivibrionales bacterium]|nr:lamin tail domain-containing protein [Chitinivibrionales bacterium]
MTQSTSAKIALFISILGIATLLLVCSRSTSPGDERPAQIFINEFMVRNSQATQFVDCVGNHEDWVELYNPGPSAVSMKSYYISDKKTDPLKKQLHDTIIPANGYYLLWGGNTVCAHNDHIGFNYGMDTLNPEMILLSSRSGVIIDSCSYIGVPGAADQDKSYGRNPDGANTWKQQATATPGATNGSYRQ